MVYSEEEGQLLTGSFVEYAIPRADDVPPHYVGAHGDPQPAQPARGERSWRNRDRGCAARNGQRGCGRFGAIRHPPS
ncbi:MAG TPA: hypothetical protein VJO34_07440 [Methylomirabilota bacterium]|nr:hypothetical protein [Methylomirabilota bacterium]